MLTAMPRGGCQVEATPMGGSLLASLRAAASANWASLTSSSPLWTVTVASAPATQAVKPWVRGAAGALSLSFGSWAAQIDVVNALNLQLLPWSCCRRFSAELFCQRGKSPGECVSLAVGDGSQTQFSSLVEWFLHFSPVCRNYRPGRLKQCCFYMLGKKKYKYDTNYVCSWIFVICLVV